MDFKEYISTFKGKKPDKTGWILLLLLGVLLLVVALPTESGGGTKTTEEKTQAMGTSQTESSLEKQQKKQEEQLEEMLAQIEGAGKVRVMVTYQDNGTQIVEKDDEGSLNQTSENSSEDGSTRKITESQNKETTIYQEQDGAGTPFVSRELLPEIEGVLVVAEGGGSPVVKQNISNAVLALFPIEAHKVVVVKMNMQEGGQ